jgi:hypothetical protein
MPYQPRVYQWTAIVHTHLPQLSKPQATVLALWSLGMVLAQSCALSAVSLYLATVLDREENTVRQQLREWYAEATAKRGTRRRELAVASCFAPLLGWVLSWYQGTQLALALDASSLGDRFVVLALSVLYRGCAIPVAWVVLPAAQPHAWKPEWLGLLAQVRDAIPAHYTVIVLADRGLYARWLYRQIVQLGWHPLLRINRGGTFRPQGQSGYLPLTHFCPAPGCAWRGVGTAFKGAACRLDCTLLARWEPGHADPWLRLTDLDPALGEAGWYGLRAWIEQSFKLTKRGGWQWQRTRMTDPERAARLWLALAVATLWLLSVGGAADATLPESTVPAVDPAQLRPRRHAPCPRLVSVGRRGRALILRALLRDAPLPTGRFWPEPWPARGPLPTTRLAQPTHELPT